MSIDIAQELSQIKEMLLTLLKQKTVKEKKPDQPPQGVVAWDVEVKNQNNEPVAVYTILTLVRRKDSDSDPGVSS